MINTNDLILEILDSDGKLKDVLKSKIEKAINGIDYKKITKIIEANLIEYLSDIDFSDMFSEDVYIDMGNKLQDKLKEIEFSVSIKKQNKEKK